MPLIRSNAHIQSSWFKAVLMNSSKTSRSQVARSWSTATPPYLLRTRTTDKRYRYRHDYTDQDHIELLDILQGLPCKVMLSGYPSDLYDQTLKGWNHLEVQVMNHAGVRTDKIWFNFEIDRYHWATFAGKNYTDRQSIRRKAANWGRMYREMPRHERMAILASIMEVERDESTASFHQN